MNDPELIEYAVYHWTFGGDHNLPGLNHDGTIDADFFDRYPINASYEDFAEQFTQLKVIQYSATKILCCYAPAEWIVRCLHASEKENLRHTQQQFLHTSYVEHDNNDLYKFNNVLLHCASSSFISSVDANAYISGIDLLSQNNFFQNTYGPTLAFALDSADDTKSFHRWLPAQALTNYSMVWKSIRGMCSRKLSELPTPRHLRGLTLDITKRHMVAFSITRGKNFFFFEVKKESASDSTKILLKSAYLYLIHSGSSPTPL